MRCNLVNTEKNYHPFHTELAKKVEEDKLTKKQAYQRDEWFGHLLRFRNDAFFISSIICLQLPFELAYAHLYEIVRSDIIKGRREWQNYDIFGYQVKAVGDIFGYYILVPVFGLYFMQTYIGLFYHAILHRNFLTLRKILTQRMIASQVLQSFVENCIPYLKYSFKKHRTVKKKNKGKLNGKVQLTSRVEKEHLKPSYSASIGEELEDGLFDCRKLKPLHINPSDSLRSESYVEACDFCGESFHPTYACPYHPRYGNHHSSSYASPQPDFYMSKPSPRSPQQERRTIENMEKDMISDWLSPSTKKYPFDDWSNSSYLQDTYSSMRNQPSKDIIRFLLEIEQDMNLTEQELDQWIKQRDQEAEEEINDNSIGKNLVIDSPTLEVMETTSKHIGLMSHRFRIVRNLHRRPSCSVSKGGTAAGSPGLSVCTSDEVVEGLGHSSPLNQSAGPDWSLDSTRDQSDPG
ncbi:hypothetical protein Sjap_007740 [Stephania japonica]|uniref:C2H2-type domain-containing protein n=1 Tax=Stephania japonica TaxID=461633 RepID=A0AAP0JP35_9MAGN